MSAQPTAESDAGKVLPCPACNGSRGYAGVSCSDCNGMGTVYVPARPISPADGRDPLECPPDGGCGGCGNWPEHCACPIPPGEPDACICDPTGPCLGAEHDTGSTIECKACLNLDPELPCLNDPEAVGGPHD